MAASKAAEEATSQQTCLHTVMHKNKKRQLGKLTNCESWQCFWAPESTLSHAGRWAPWAVAQQQAYQKRPLCNIKRRRIVCHELNATPLQKCRHCSSNNYNKKQIINKVPKKALKKQKAQSENRQPHRSSPVRCSFVYSACNAILFLLKCIQKVFFLVFLIFFYFC